jgi:PTH1 family peptidyl-tRNA hydrolase
MKLVVGLGNPGDKYQQNRHNVGFVVVKTLIKNLQLKSQIHNFKFKTEKKFDGELVQFENLFLFKPMTYMNNSGEAVRKVKDFYGINLEDVWVMHDDLDIRLGEYKISKRGPKIHNGVNSVRRAIGEGFWYVRIGVDNRKDQVASNKFQDTNKLQSSMNVNLRVRMPGQQYVLSNFLENEKEVIGQVSEQVAEEILKRLQ